MNKNYFGIVDAVHFDTSETNYSDFKIKLMKERGPPFIQEREKEREREMMLEGPSVTPDQCLDTWLWKM